MVHSIESLLEVNEDRLSENTVIHSSTKKGYGCFSGEILPEARLIGRKKIVSVYIAKQLMIYDFLRDFLNHWENRDGTIIIHFFSVTGLE